MKSMKAGLEFFLITVLTLFFPLLSHAGPGTPFNSIVYFGDSLSDNGNLYWYDWGFLPKSPPYYEGRFTNGYVWSELVGKYFYDKNYTKAVNYAFGGETALYHGPMSGYLPYNISWSLKSYLLRTMMQDRTNTLFVIWIGANDYLPGNNEIEKVTSDVVAAIRATIESLIYHGGMNFLIINLPDMAKTPYGTSSMIKEVLSLSTLLHNTKLDTAVQEIASSYKQVNIQLMNANKMFDKLVSNPDYYNKKYKTNIVHTAVACWQGNYTWRGKEDVNRLETALLDHLKKQYTRPSTLDPHPPTYGFDQKVFLGYITSSPALLEVNGVTERAAAGVEPCAKPHEFVFWDRVHPTANVHLMFSYKVIEFLEERFQQKVK